MPANSLLVSILERVFCLGRVLRVGPEMDFGAVEAVDVPYRRRFIRMLQKLPTGTLANTETNNDVLF